MCGRFALIDYYNTISEHFSIDEILGEYQVSYNIPPGGKILSVIIKEDKRILAPLQWGLIPFWSKEPSIGGRMINARAETIQEKPSFRHAVKSNRCLIVASGFFEWEKKEKSKDPVFIYMKNREPFGMAGVYDRWISPAGLEIISCAIITTGANSLLMPIHDRMPVIIQKNMHDRWLNTSGSLDTQVIPLLKPFPPELMSFHHVSKTVNSPKHNTPECIEPLQ